jgi:cytochrome c biogenesis protein ResB
MSPFTRLYRILASRSVALLLLVTLALVAIAGGLISQLSRAGVALPALLARLSLNDLFAARWLLIVAAALVVNLLLCSLARIRLRLLEPGQIRGLLHFRQVVTSIPVAESATIIREELRERKFSVRRQTKTGRTLITGRRNRLSLAGSIFMHVAFVLGFVGFVVRSKKGFEGDFELFPEQSHALVVPGGDTVQVQLVDYGESYNLGPGMDNYILRQRHASLVLYRNNHFVRAAGIDRKSVV